MFNDNKTCTTTLKSQATPDFKVNFPKPCKVSFYKGPQRRPQASKPCAYVGIRQWVGDTIGWLHGVGVGHEGMVISWL